MILAGAVFKDLKIGLIVISTTQVIYSVCIYLWLQKIAEIHDQKCQQVD
jgi:hypothetical protein